MDRLRILNDYEVLRVIPTLHKQHLYKVRKDKHIYRITAVPLKVSTQHPSRQIQRIVQLLEKCNKYQQLAHPNVQTISELFHYQNEGKDYLCIVGEYSAEGDIEDLIQEEKNKKTYDVRQAMIDLGAGLEYLHSQSITHTAITPENIRKIDGKYKITFPSFCEIDWFNRKTSRQSSKQSNAVDYYMSPEIKKEKYFSLSSDVWSLGIIFYQLLSSKQFRLCSQVRPYEMGNFSQEMLRDISNGMMRSLLKEMLNSDSKGRIGVDRVKNILVNTDISLEDVFEEQIIEERNYHTLTLPIFYTDISSKKHTDFVDDQKNNRTSEHRSVQVALEGFRVVLIYKFHNDSLQFCLYSYEIGCSFMFQYPYSRLPSSFTEIFSSSHEIFQEFNRETLNIAYLNSFGQFVIAFEQNRYLTFKTAKKQKRQIAQKRPNEQAFYIESSTDSSRKRSLADSNGSVLTEGEKLYLQTVAEYGQNSQQALYLLQELSRLEKEDPNGTMKKLIQYQEKIINLLLNQDKYNKQNCQRIYQSLQQLSYQYYLLRNYTKCIELNQRAYSYFVSLNILYCLPLPLSHLIFCNQILNDKQQLDKWQKIIENEYPQLKALCLLRTAMLFLYALKQSPEVGKEAEMLMEMVEVYEVKVIHALDSTERIQDFIIHTMLATIIRLFKQSYINLYQLGSISLTKVYKQIKNSHIHKHSRDYLLKELKAIAKIIFAPKCKAIVRKWVKQNMPQNQIAIFGNNKTSTQYSIFDSLF